MIKVKAGVQELELVKFFSLSADPFCIANLCGYFEFLNPAFTRLLEYSEEELLSTPFLHFIHPGDVEPTEAIIYKIESGEIINQFHNRYMKRSGEVCWLCWSVAFAKEGKIYASAKDITAQQLAEEALIKSERSYKSIFNSGPLPQFIFDLDTLRFLNVNDAALRHYGYSIGEFLQKSLLNIRPAQSYSSLHKVIDRIRETDTPITYTATHIKKSGAKIRVEITASKVFYKGEQVAVATINDITEKLRLQEELTKEKVLREKKITQATIAAQEQEREYLGRELHDNINQILTSTKLFLEYAETNADMKDAFIRKSKENINAAIKEVRFLSKALVPSTLKDISMIEAVQELMDTYKSTHAFQVHFDGYRNLDCLSEGIKMDLYRVIQEGLNNIAKYARAKNVWLDIQCNEQIQLSLRDDGVGFDPSKKGKGIGLANIRNRVEYYEGTLKVTALPGKGCSLTIHIPKVSKNKKGQLRIAGRILNKIQICRKSTSIIYETQ